MSWYSSVEACLASSLTAGGSTTRATTTATSNPDPRDSVTLHSQPQTCPFSAQMAALAVHTSGDSSLSPGTSQARCHMPCTGARRFNVI